MARHAPAEVVALWQRVTRQCPALRSVSSLALGFSGGLDSTVLLHLLCCWRDAGLLTAGLRALHIHHGLQSAADDWLQHCQRQCQRWQVPLSVRRVQVANTAGRGLEEAARAARYEAFLQLLARDEGLLLAHHADDQAETVLLHLLRGSGVLGLAAMPALRDLDGHPLLRPLLSVSRQELLDYACSHGLQWVEDPSNGDQHHDRNFLRHDILPRLAARWPAAISSLGRSAVLAAEAAEVLDALAEQLVGGADGANANRLPLAVIAAQPRAQARLLLRTWLRRQALAFGAPAPTFQEVERCWQDLVTGATGGYRKLLLAGGRLHLHAYREALTLLPPLPPLAPELLWHPHEPLMLPAPLGSLHWCAAEPAPATLTVRFGVEGLRVPKRDGHTQSLSQFWQQQGVPPWLRVCVPFVFCAGELVAIGEWPLPPTDSSSHGNCKVLLRWQRSHLLCGW